MPLVQWQDGLLVGNAVIDEDHRVTVEQLNALVGASDADFPHLFAEFVTHLREHFGREDALMQEHDFPAFPIHNGEHRRVLAECDRFVNRIENGSLAMARAYVAEIAPNWFMTHLATMDAATAAYIRNVSAAA